MTDYDYAVSAARAWRATYAAGWKAYQDATGGTEQARVDKAMGTAVLTYLRLCPDLDSAARTLAGREAPPRRVLEAEDRRDFRELLQRGSLGCDCGHMLSDHSCDYHDDSGDPVNRRCRMPDCTCGTTS
jgi:hypothetical protein